jgi:pilus assembly protein Flp/PilA
LVSFGAHDLRSSGHIGERFMFATLMELRKNKDGATAIEYGLIAALIAVAAIVALQLVGTNLSDTFHGIATQL